VSTATESKHTPGAMRAARLIANTYDKVLIDAGFPWSTKDGGATDRLALIIDRETAAPALLEALEEMVAFGKRQGWAHVAIIDAEDAIRLAKGESQ
jgi:NADPH-dependent ferric siderophore reductase